MPSISFASFQKKIVGSEILTSQVGVLNPKFPDQTFVDQTYLKAAIAFAVGCWEGYVESGLREFLAKIRMQSHRQAWSLIIQFEIMVDKRVSQFSTPNWEKVRALLIEITGMDPYPGWIWSPKFANQTDTKAFFDGVMDVRHACAHGFDTPLSVPGLANPGILDMSYFNDVIEYLCFLSLRTDELLEYELKHRHGCRYGWN